VFLFLFFVSSNVYFGFQIAIMEIDGICALVAQLIKTNIIHHIHCYGINHLASNGLVDKLTNVIDEVGCVSLYLNTYKFLFV